MMPLTTSAQLPIRSSPISASDSTQAAPLRTEQGLNLGTVWVIDQKPRELASGEAEMLRALAALAMNQMELRLYAEKVARLEHAERTIGEQLREVERATTSRVRNDSAIILRRHRSLTL